VVILAIGHLSTWSIGGSPSLENFFLDPFIFCWILSIEDITAFVENSNIKESSQKRFIRVCEKIKNLKPNQTPSQIKDIQTKLNTYFKIMLQTLSEKIDPSKIYKNSQEEKKEDQTVNQENSSIPTKSSKKKKNKAPPKEDWEKLVKKLKEDSKRIEKLKEDPKRIEKLNKDYNICDENEDSNICDEEMKVILRTKENDKEEEIKVKYPKEFLEFNGHFLGNNFFGHKRKQNSELEENSRGNMSMLYRKLTDSIKREGILHFPEDLKAVMFDLNKKVREHVQKIIKREVETVKAVNL